MSISIINRYIHMLSSAFIALDKEIDSSEIEYLATIVHNAMENNRRHYHNSKHVFDLCQHLNPIQTIAAIFHDVIYYQIDGGYASLAKPIIEDIVDMDNVSNSMVISNIANQDKLVKLCAEIFNFKAGQTLSVFSGFNEFISAVLSLRLLHKHLTITEQIQILACIEATIPFRGLDQDGLTCMQQLAQRVESVCIQNHCFEDQDKLNAFKLKTIQDAVVISNQDVAGFAEEDPAEFLSATWQLIDESNAPLKPLNFYTLQQYRSALWRMQKFLSSLDYRKIFHQFENTPSSSILAKNELYAQSNLDFASNYICAKICSVAIVEAIALETGGDCPISLFLGDIRCYEGTPDRIEKFLPNNIQDNNSLNTNLLDVLAGGRSKESRNDLTSSPLTAYFYRIVGHEEMLNIFKLAEKMFSDEITPHQFLRSLDRFLVQSIIQGCKKIAISRTNHLDDLAKTLH